MNETVSRSASDACKRGPLIGQPLPTGTRAHTTVLLVEFLPPMSAGWFPLPNRPRRIDPLSQERVQDVLAGGVPPAETPETRRDVLRTLLGKRSPAHTTPALGGRRNTRGSHSSPSNDSNPEAVNMFGDGRFPQADQPRGAGDRGQLDRVPGVAGDQSVRGSPHVRAVTARGKAAKGRSALHGRQTGPTL